MSEIKTIENVHVEIYGHEMLSELITRARKNNIPYDKGMKYDFHSHGHSYLVLKDGELTLLEDPSEKHGEEISLNRFFELYLSKEESKKELGVTNDVTLGWCVGENGALIYKTKEGYYGFDCVGDWRDYTEYSNYETKYRKATPQEVEQALIEEAKRRYKVGDVIKCLGGVESEVNGTAFVFNNNSLFSNGERVNGGDWFNTSAKVFENGKWAAIIEQDKFAELKEAHRNGAVIQWNNCGVWVTTDYPEWNNRHEYRIKPEEKPKVGDVVKAWVDDENEYFIGVLDYINVNGDYVVKFQNSHDTSIYTFKARHAKTLTQQEAIDLLFNSK